jgi:uncharacterized membrane protein YfhO
MVIDCIFHYLIYLSLVILPSDKFTYINEINNHGPGLDLTLGNPYYPSEDLFRPINIFKLQTQGIQSNSIPAFSFYSSVKKAEDSTLDLENLKKMGRIGVLPIDADENLIDSLTQELKTCTVPRRTYYHVEEITFNRVRLSIDTNCNTVLLHKDAFSSDWKATVNDREQKILNGFYAFKAIYIPKGVHQVTFRYTLINVEISFYLIQLAFLVLILININAALNTLKLKLVQNPRSSN